MPPLGLACARLPQVLAARARLWEESPFFFFLILNNSVLLLITELFHGTQIFAQVCSGSASDRTGRNLAFLKPLGTTAQ